MLKYRPKHKSFDYKPRFYDAEKEELMQRVDRYHKEGKDVDIETTKDNIRFSLRNYRPDRAQLGLKKKLINESNMRVIIILIALCFLVYMVMMSDQIIRMVGSN